jgi:NDP-sugar pyrophosphorylase family protein
MAGHGRRFAPLGFSLPKPLLPLLGRPAFWWAAESVIRLFDVRSMVFVVLQEHVDHFGIEHAVRRFYPDAAVVVLPEPTNGALLSAMAGVRVVGDGWLIVNDCDHAFTSDRLAATVLHRGRVAEGFLCHFHAQDAAYSYGRYDTAGRLLETAEKRVISDLAIAGAYGFRDRRLFLDHAAAYLGICGAAEPVTSGVYNSIVAAGGIVQGGMLDCHVPFGTPDAYAGAERGLAALRERWAMGPRKMEFVS